VTQCSIIVGDVRTCLDGLEAGSVHCAVTSPPYFGLRDYGCDGQIGLEDSPQDYIAELVAVFGKLRRVLRDDGTLWINLGDSYAGSWGAQSRENAGKDAPNPSKISANQIRAAQKRTQTGSLKNTPGLKNKDRMMIPARVAIALQADGWWLRDEIVWHKPNPMPTSVGDRTTPAHEMLYMFAKSPRYFYDMEAVKEPVAGRIRKAQRRRPTKLEALPPRHASFKAEHTAIDSHESGGVRQPRSVWTITPKPFKGAHFATFPPDLVRPCILAGSPHGGTVLDPFFGSGTTGAVANDLGRSCIGIELNPLYAEMARERCGVVEW
jgi:DNA modification methylase